MDEELEEWMEEEVKEEEGDRVFVVGAVGLVRRFLRAVALLALVLPDLGSGAGLVDIV